MNMLVTGGAGFMGSSFVRYVLGNDLVDRVVVLDALTYAGNLDNLVSVADDPCYTFVHGDIRDRKLVEEIVQKHKIDTIVHFAAETHVDRSIEDPEIFTSVNVHGTMVLLDVAGKHDLRFHHISTDEVFGSLSNDDAPSDEMSPYRPRNPYSASKAASNHFVRAHYETFGTRTTISYASNNYGPHQYPEKVIPLFVARLLGGERVPLYGDGSNIRHWLYVDDHAVGVWKIVEQGTIGEAYCLGGERGMSNRELTERLLAILEKDDSYIEHVEDRKGHDFRYEISSEKARKELGWEPTVTFEEGILKTVEWYKENHT